MRSLLFLVVSSAAASPAAPDYTLERLPAASFPLATCLDPTSMGAYYFRPALTPAAANKVRIFFEGGGCELL